MKETLPSVTDPYQPIEATMPNKMDMGIGIIGSGFIVNDCHLPAYNKAGFKTLGLASRNQEKALQVAKRHQIPHTYPTVEALLEDERIQVLDIAVPPNAQLEMIRKAVTKKHLQGILAQKPLGMNLDEACEAVSLCEQAGIALAVNQNMRYDPSVRAAKNLLDAGKLGEPVLTTLDMRAIPHWMPWQKDLGWVTLRIMSIHHLDCFRYWFGDPLNIYCSVCPDPRTPFEHQDGICSYILEYASGLRCVGIDDTWTGPAREGCPADIGIQWRIEGSQGLAIGDIGWCQDPYTTPSRLRYASIGDHDFHQPQWDQSWFPDAFAGTMAQLLVGLEGGQSPEISGRDNLKTMALVEAAYRSCEEKRAISLSEMLPLS